MILPLVLALMDVAILLAILYYACDIAMQKRDR